MLLLTRFWRWHPQVALRYLSIAEDINKNYRKGNKILEVGSGSLGIAPYLNKKVTGADIEFPPPFFPLLKRVKTDAANLPFENSSFDFVICVDMLEHITKKRRSKVLNELIRVTKQKLYLAFPSGKKSFKQDKKFAKKYQEIFGKSFSFFEDHLKYGLPHVEAVILRLKRSSQRYNKKISIKVEGNLNLSLRRFLMKGFITKNFFVNLFFRKILLFALPVLKIIDRSPYYRRVLFVDINTIRERKIFKQKF